MTKLKDIVALSPGFKAEVNIESDMDNDAKVAAYIPTMQSRDVFENFATQLHPASSNRSRLLMGTYGTGKSHLALVLARMYSHGADDPAVTPVVDKLQKWNDLAIQLKDSRGKLKGKFLLVLLYGDAGPFNDVLLRGLEQALRGAGLADLLPETAFDAAISRIDAIKSDPMLWSRFEQAVPDYGFQSVEALREALRKKTRDAFDRFCKLHESLFVGVPFSHFDFTRPHEAYRAVSRRLVEENTGYKGICVIWDEFGRYMEGVVEDPRGDEGDAIQQFAEKAVNSSGASQIHLYLVCHRSLRDYLQLSALSRVGALTRADDEAWTRISGRFREFVMTTTDHEVFELIDNVIVQKTDTPEWSQFLESAAQEIEAATAHAQHLRLFPDFSRDVTHEVVTLGAYPLHPMAAFMLPRVSQRVAQNSRTLFKFLSHDDASPLGDFIKSTTVDGYVAFPADGLWSYFENDLADHPQYRDLMKRFARADGMVSPDDTLAKRIIRAVALLHLVSSDKAQPTGDAIAFALGQIDSKPIDRKLEELCGRRGEGEQILALSVHNNTYRFPGVASDLGEKVVRLAAERSSTVQLGTHLRRYASQLGFPSKVTATAYSDDVGTERWAEVELALAAELSDSARWRNGLAAAPYVDARLLLVLAESRDDIDRAVQAARGELKNPQLMLAVPKQPTVFSQLAQRHETLVFLEASEQHLYGHGAPLRSEWEEHFEDYSDALTRALSELLKPDTRLVDWWVDGQALDGITLQSKLSAAVSRMMHSVFFSTPRLGPAKLTSDDGNDTYAKIRRPIIDKLIRQDGPQLLSRETAKEQISVIEAFFVRNGVLVKSGQRSVIHKPDTASNPEMAAVWDAIEGFMARVRDEGRLPISELVQTLRMPPFGLRERSIPLLFAAVARDHFVRSNLSIGALRGRGAGVINSPDGKAIDEAVISGVNHTLIYTDIGHKQHTILRGVADAFGVSVDGEDDAGKLIDAICAQSRAWWVSLDRFAQLTSSLDNRSQWLRDKVLAPMGDGTCDPRSLLLELLPTRIGGPDGEEPSSGDVCNLIGAAIRDIEQAPVRLRASVIECIRGVLADGYSGAAEAAVVEWANSLSAALVARPQYGDVEALLKTVRVARDSGLDADGLVGLAVELVGQPLEAWNDSTVDRLRGHLEGAKKHLEAADAPGEVVESTDSVVVPRPEEDMVRIVVVGPDSLDEHNITHSDDLSAAAETALKVIRSQLTGMKGSMRPGEIEQVLLSLIEEFM